MDDNESHVNCNSENLSYIKRIGKNPLKFITIGQQLSVIACEDGDREAYVFVEENKRFTYKELLQEADRLAAGLKCLGLEQGDRVCFIAPNVSIWPVVMFATVRAGLILVLLNPTYEAQEIAYSLKKVSAKVLIVPQNYGYVTNYYDKLLENFPELKSCDPRAIECKSLPDLSTIIIDSDENYPGTLRLRDVMAMSTISQINSIEKHQDDISPFSRCIIQFTSGFTGAPKAVQLNHFGLINTGFTLERLKQNYTRICVPLSFCHVYAFNVAMAALCNQGTIIVPSYFYDPVKTLRACWKEKSDVIYGMPKYFLEIMTKQKELKLDIKEMTAVTGGPCSPELFFQLKKNLGFKKLLMVLGMTEYSGISFISFPEDPDDKIISKIGCVLDHVEVKIIDRDGKLVPFGTPGELCIRGYLTMDGYWEDESKTKKILESDGWLKTGDYFILDPNGYGEIIGRMNEIICKGKERIFPRDIENLLVSYHKISEAYVVGVPDDNLGEELCAFVGLREGFETISSEEIYEFCNGKISSSQIPRYVEVLKVFPKTIAGKIKKWELKNLFLTKKIVD